MLSAIVLTVTLGVTALGLRSPRRSIARAVAMMALTLVMLLAAVLITHRWATDPTDTGWEQIRWAAGFAAPLAVFAAAFFAELPAFTPRWPASSRP